MASKNANPRGTDNVGANALGGAQRFKRWVRPLTLTLALGFMGFAAWELSRRWSSSEVVSPRLAWAALALAPLLAAGLLQAMAWVFLTEHMAGRRLPRAYGTLLYLESQLARYTPGKLGLPLVRMAGAPRLGVPAWSVGVSVLIEHVSWIAVGGGLGFGLFAFGKRDRAGVTGLFGDFALPILAASIAVVLVMTVLDRSRLPQRVRGWLRLEGKGSVIGPSLPVLQLGFWGGWVLHGICVTVAFRASAAEALAVSGLFVLAPLAGFLALAAPAGVGVREAVLVVGLSPLLGAPGALGAVLVSRACSFVSDFFLWFLVYGVGKKRGFA
ncbi:MAG TPA: lysylphosphatidylglycerol synthase domain-containing protein [Polyangiaceae bacterium]|jgi:hypothetical protein